MKVTTKLVGPGERTVYADGEYVGVITREWDGWKWTGHWRPFTYFIDAARWLVDRKMP